jgi:hypothetical protein
MSKKSFIGAAVAVAVLSTASLAAAPANAAVVYRTSVTRVGYYGPNATVKHVGYTRVTPYGVKHVGYTRVWR